MSRTRRSGLSVEEFRRQYELPNVPVVLTDAVTRWRALGTWDRPLLRRAFAGRKVVAGNYPMDFDTYLAYCDSQRDDMPLYLFDSDFCAKAPQLAADFSVPPHFAEDLFAVLGPSRPDHRWLIMGPPRSGSSFHVDPNATSAWNGVISGSKKWILYPPHVIPPGKTQCADNAGQTLHQDYDCSLCMLVAAFPRAVLNRRRPPPHLTLALYDHLRLLSLITRSDSLPRPPTSRAATVAANQSGVHPSADGADVATPVSLVEWFLNFYAATKEGKVKPIECVVRAGELIFVPSGWWHLALNLEESVAITQNYVSRANLPAVLKFLASKREDLVSGCSVDERSSLHDRFVDGLKAQRPAVYAEVAARQAAAAQRVEESKKLAALFKPAAAAAAQQAAGSADSCRRGAEPSAVQEAPAAAAAAFSFGFKLG